MEHTYYSEGIPASVLKQIEARQNLFGKEYKTAEDLAVINENTAWAVLRAGILTPKNDADRYRIFTQEEGFPELWGRDAQDGILGGELQSVDLIGGEVEFGDNGYVHRARPAGVQLTENHYGPAYRITTYQGHRPISGITGVSVRSLDTWGMILEATVNLKVWSRDELEDLDRIYFKPGFPALLEWGHTLYVREDGTVEKNPRLMVSDAEFFRNKSENFLDLDEIILKRRTATCNQEACFGYITNFSYSFQKNGSYDCTVKILSKGTLLNNLQLKEGGSEDTKKTDANDVQYANRSIFHSIHRAFDQALKEDHFVAEVPGDPTREPESIQDLRSFPPRKEGSGTLTFSGREAILNYTGFREDQKEQWEKVLQDFPVIRVPINVRQRGLGRKGTITEGEYYVTLRSLLYLINVFNSVNGLVSFDLWSTARYVTVPNMASLNPYIVILPEQSDGQTRTVQIQTEATTADQTGFQNPGVPNFGGAYGMFTGGNVPGRSSTKVNSNTKTLEYQLDFNPVEGATDFNEVIDWELGRRIVDGSTDYFSNVGGPKILNLWVNYGQFILDIEQELSNTDNYSIKSILERLLKKIQKALGNLSDFQIVSNQRLGGSVFEIVDVKCIYNHTLPGEITVTGLNSTVSNLTIQSDVSPDLANSMCIAAQAPKDYEDGFASTDQCMVHWGENCKPMWIADESGLKSASAEDEAAERQKFEEERSDWYRDLGKAYQKFRKKDIIRVSRKELEGNVVAANEQVEAVAMEVFEDLQLQGEKFRRAEARKCLDNVAYRDANLAMGIIPIRMGLTMMGIGRFTVGTTFRIKDGVLPRKYRDWGYIVTGIDHSITKSGWTTTLKTQYYPVYWREKAAGTVDLDPTIWDRSRVEHGVATTGTYTTGAGVDSIIPQTQATIDAINGAETLYDAFTQKSGFSWPGTGQCAWFVAGWAHAYLEGKKFLASGRRTKPGRIGPACSAGGHANNLYGQAENYVANLRRIGYVEVKRVTQQSPLEICNYLNNNAEPGDIAVYWDPNRVDGHTQFCVGKNGNKTDWVADFKQATAWRNSKEANGTVKKYTLVHLMPSSPAHSDWKSIR